MKPKDSKKEDKTGEKMENVSETTPKEKRGSLKPNIGSQSKVGSRDTMTPKLTQDLTKADEKKNDTGTPSTRADENKKNGSTVNEEMANLLISDLFVMRDRSRKP
ncbi:GL15353 [Drosophila persimilis]|uniref:GL15353 n=1 Tax=Drosophila persimilis TaxID=7234 RepID=B4HD41_DROPE|nr:GL15353 [Drosophila persimilis]